MSESSISWFVSQAYPISYVVNVAIFNHLVNSRIEIEPSMIEHAATGSYFKNSIPVAT